MRRTRIVATTAASLAALLALSACGGTRDAGTDSSGGASDTITVGTTDKVIALDPAGTYDTGSFVVDTQVYPFLFNTPYGSPDVEPDVAESGEFTSPNVFTVKVKSGLKFANGHDLTASDVAYSYNRTITLANENGPSSLLANIAKIEAPDDSTVVFTLAEGVENDVTLEQVLSSPAGPIVDEEVFPEDKLLSDDEVVKAKPFAGPYTLTSFKLNESAVYEANPEYKGLWGAPETKNVQVRYYADASNLKLDVQDNKVDVAYRSLGPTDIADLRNNDNVNVVDGPGGEIRYIVFNFFTQPFGTKTDDADPAKALAVRQAVADLIDRNALSEDVYKGTYTPLFSYVPDGLSGATTPLKEKYGDGNGGPSLDKAQQVLSDAGVSTPVELNLQYNGDHYGESSADEYAAIKSQLEEGGLFTVNLNQTEYTTYSSARANTAEKDGDYPAYQLGWFPDYSDADNYLSPFFRYDDVNADSRPFLQSGYQNKEVDSLIQQQAGTTDEDARTTILEQIQDKVADDLPTVPYLQGNQVAITAKNVSGADKTLDASFKFRYGALSKSS